MSEICTGEHSEHKVHAFEILNECYNEIDEEEVNPVVIQSIERNFLKLFGIVL